MRPGTITNVFGFQPFLLFLPCVDLRKDNPWMDGQKLSLHSRTDISKKQAQADYSILLFLSSTKL
jgi:hypothetical protein